MTPSSGWAQAVGERRQLLQQQQQLDSLSRDSGASGVDLPVRPDGGTKPVLFGDGST